MWNASGTYDVAEEKRHVRVSCESHPHPQEVLFFARKARVMEDFSNVFLHFFCQFLRGIFKEFRAVLHLRFSKNAVDCCGTKEDFPTAFRNSRMRLWSGRLRGTSVKRSKMSVLCNAAFLLNENTSCFLHLCKFL